MRKPRTESLSTRIAQLSKWPSVALTSRSWPAEPTYLTMSLAACKVTVQGCSPQACMSEVAEHELRGNARSPNFPNSVFWPTQGSIIVGIDYDCRERMVYWTDVAARTISRVSLEPGAEPETIINSGQQLHPEDTPISFDSIKSTLFLPVYASLSSIFTQQGKLNAMQVTCELYNILFVNKHVHA